MRRLFHVLPVGWHAFTIVPVGRRLPHGNVRLTRRYELAEQESTSIIRMPAAGLLAWLVPGLGHIYIGERTRGMVYLITVTLTFWTGVAIGSVQGTVAPKSRKLWFVAQVCTGGNALAAYALHRQVDPKSASSETLMSAGHWASAEVGVHYTGVAGLLNLLIIFDAIARADPSFARRRKELEQAGGVP